ncbi:hypothetical protein Clacol_001636 [Clathrus columnatus]|uniref:CID domain-containing protein n=1 Tax=Clathrus columnatus TaxID=1419009 RepID=A0AAV5A3V5_9AGAM|nr:hypothetical protein Clacol_001636 [Clathrus columnatus]
MSLHGYPENYGTVGYAQHSPSYQYPPAPDPNTFRQFYASQLATLTFNSRPIIQNLSMIAQDYNRLSNIVVQCIEAHIRRVPPNVKLPAWYLLDAISKNVPVPYAGLFAPLVADLFLESYYQVDPPTRGKMEEMLLTWRDGGQHNREVFGVVPQVALERAIWQSGGGSVNIMSRSSPPKTNDMITKAQVLADLEVTLAQQQRKLHFNPYDTVPSQHVEVLKQLRTLVQTTHVKQHELVAIDKQLRQMSVPHDLPSYPDPAHPPSSSHHSPSAVSPPYATSVPPNPLNTSTTLPFAGPDYGQYMYPQTNVLHPPLNTLPVVSSQPPLTQTIPSVSTPANIADLFNSLVKAGVVSAPVISADSQSSVPTNTGITPPETKFNEEYEQKIMSINISLNTADIMRKHTSIVPFIYDDLRLQCRQCAARYPDDKDGKKQMEDHLDMHFRQNQKAGLNTGRGHIRCWFIGAKDWIQEVIGDSKGKNRMEDSPTAIAAAQEAKLRESYVIVPPGDEAKSVQCPVCKETLKSEFLEEDEDWAWKNAVRVQGRIYHATCHAETSTATSLASRLRYEVIGDHSRPTTPDTGLDRNTPPRVTSSINSSVKKSPSPDTQRIGVKRKIEDSENTKQEPDETPPFKKVALLNSH